MAITTDLSPSKGTIKTHSRLPITVTDHAINKVKQLIEEEENPNLYLRIFITPNGCQGLEYGFAFEDHALEQNCCSDNLALDQNDLVMEAGSIKIIVRQEPDLTYLSGATIDYQSDINGDRFVVHNPNAEHTCGCGKSFCVKESNEDPEDKFE